MNFLRKYSSIARIIYTYIIITNHFMFNKPIFAILLLTISLSAAGQNVLKGHVSDSKTNEPLVGAGVVLKGNATTGTVTDLNGNYELKVSPTSTLVFSCIGYVSQEVAVNGQSRIDIALDEDTSLLDEVVVVGYGTQKKVNLTGSVSQVKMDEIAANRPVTSIADALMGNVPGLVLSGNSGEPGSGYNFTVRGTSSINGGSPLILVDGVSIDISSLNPNDIESVSVLKDASASAIYGARAAFGVILITTKKADSDQAPKITLSAKMALSSPQSMAERATPYETIHALNNFGYTTFGGGQILSEWENLLLDYEANPSKYPNGYAELNDIHYQLAQTDVTDDMLTTGIQQVYDLAVSGGSKKTRYRFSAGALNEDGVLVTNKDSYKRISVTSFVSTEIKKWLTAELTGLYTGTDKSDPYRSTFNSRDVWAQAVCLPSFYPTGTINIGDKEYRYATPSHILDTTVPTQSNYNRINLLGRLILKPFEGFTLTGEYSINKTFYTSKEFNKVIDDLADGNTSAVLPANEPYSTYRFQKSSTDYNALNVYAAYNKEISGHEFTLMAGINVEQYSNENLTASRANMINDEMPALSLATEVPNVSDSYTDNALFGTFYRVNYNYKGKYLLEATGRFDGSSKFPEGHRFGFFPSFSAGWRIDQEGFMKGADWVSMLKLRGSWGSIGNQNISEYQFLPTMTSGKANWGISEVKPLTLNTPSLVRADFTWEEVRTINAGLDWGFFDNRLIGSFDIFKRNTLNMLGPGPDYPTTLGAGSPLQNAADMQTNGWEIQVNWRDDIGQVHYGIGFNLSDARSRINKYNNPTKSLDMTYYEGMELGEIWGFVSDRLYTVDDFVDGTLVTTGAGALTGGTLKDGIPHYEGATPNPGDMLFKYADENGLIWKADNTADNPGSRRIIGNSTPRYTFGINANVSWKGLALSVLLQGVGKRDLWLHNSFTSPFASGGFEYSFYKNLLDYWSVDNQDAFFARKYYSGFSANGSANTAVQTRYLFDASYLDIKSVVLSYTFPAKLIQKAGIGGVTVFANGENLFSFNHMPDGIHPDSKSRGYASGVSQGGLTYPVMRKITFGVNLTF